MHSNFMHPNSTHSNSAVHALPLLRLHALYSTQHYYYLLRLYTFQPVTLICTVGRGEDIMLWLYPIVTGGKMFHSLSHSFADHSCISWTSPALVICTLFP